ncbi:hypothetical protein H311_00270 [Anncaliia algerae PRA109]|nr:hypothetical protein H311_00270 [Anncaliia algerae PRA109]
MKNNSNNIEVLIMQKYNFLIGKPNCIYCDKAIDLLKLKNIEYIYLDYLECEEFLDALRKAKGKVTFPQIFLSGERIGGFTDLEKHYEQNL